MSMRERPILFSAPMVRAILDGRKSVTRRVVNRVASLGPVTEFGKSDTPGYAWHCRDRRALWNDLRDDELLARCPYGRPGDRLWVRETFIDGWDIGPDDLPKQFDEEGNQLPPRVWYRATDDGEFDWQDEDGYSTDRVPWKPSIHMPRWASRITLEVTAVRVERLQDISEAQAHAEGIDGEALFRAQGWAPLAFERLWESINDAGSWAENPWVWAVEFKRVEVPRGGG